MLSGTIVQWNDERGFGFLVTEDATRYFVHATALQRATPRPVTGVAVRFVPARRTDGRLVAQNVELDRAGPLKTGGRRSAPAARSGRLVWQGFAACILLLLLCMVVAFDRAPLWLGAAYLASGAVTALLYHTDKRAAEQGQWRINETTLLTLDLCFGIIGGLLAQAMLRHKTRKPSYVNTMAVFTVVHLLWLGGLAGGWIHLAAAEALFH